MKIFILLKKIRQKMGKSPVVPFSNPLFSLTNKPINQPTNKQQQKNPNQNKKLFLSLVCILPNSKNPHQTLAYLYSICIYSCVLRVFLFVHLLT